MSHPLQITADLNPGCDACDNATISLVHVRAIGAYDELHYLWDFTGRPAVMLLRFDGITTPVNMTIDWPAFWDGRASVKFSREPQYYFGIVLHTLYEYNDRTDEATFEAVTDPEDIVAWDLKDFVWQRQSLKVSEDKAAIKVTAQQMVTTRSGHGGPRITTVGDIALTFTTHGTAGHSMQIPHLLHTENATEIDLILRDMRVERDFACPRMAVGVTVVSLRDKEEKVKGNFSLNVRRSVDDEFTPGIFELINLSAKGENSDEGFVQYRPVSYTNDARDVSVSTLVRQSSPTAVAEDIDPLAETIFASVEGVLQQRAMVENMNVSFGVRGDGCFGKTNYTTWTFVVAYGQPMPEKLSTLVVILAALGLGIPLILLISGGCYVCLRKARAS